MKKLLTIILIIALALPVAALSAEKEVDPFYGYAHIDVDKNGVPFMTFIYFAENQTCYYLTQLFQGEEVGLGRAYVGMWGYTADGDVFAKTGDNVTSTYAITSLGSIVDKKTMDVFWPVDTLMK